MKVAVCKLVLQSRITSVYHFLSSATIPADLSLWLFSLASLCLDYEFGTCGLPFQIFLSSVLRFLCPWPHFSAPIFFASLLCIHHTTFLEYQSTARVIAIFTHDRGTRIHVGDWLVPKMRDGYESRDPWILSQLSWHYFKDGGKRYIWVWAVFIDGIIVVLKVFVESQLRLQSTSG